MTALADALSSGLLDVLAPLGPLDSLDAATAAQQRLRSSGVAPELAIAAVTQARLRSRAVAKFGDAAGDMLFTEAGLQQATRAEVAVRHAERFRAAGITTVADLGCGIGADAIALSAAGLSVLAVDRDPDAAAACRHNLARFPRSRVEIADAAEVELDGIDAVFLDPARRAAGRRLASPGDWSPSLDIAFGFAESRPTGVKLGPAIDHALIPNGAEAQWVSVRGEVVEVGVWFGPLARPGIGRSALVIDRDGTEHELSGPGDGADPEVRPLGTYVVDPDGAVIRARQLGPLADLLVAGSLDPTIAYLTTDTRPDSVFGQGFEVLDESAFDTSAMRSMLARHDVGTLEIKKRGVDVEPATLRRRLRLRGSASATLILSRIGDRRRALLTRRLR